MRSLLYRLYRALEAQIAPGLAYSQSTYGDFLASRVQAHARWLDLGCGHQLLPEWDLEKERRIVDRAGFVVGLDPDREAIRKHTSIRYRLTGWGDCLPFADGSFDVVTMNMVVEHLEYPVTVFREIRRVLSPGGVVVFHTPNLEGYATQIADLLPEAAKAPLARLLHGRASADVYPTHYRCNTLADITEVAAQAALDIDEIALIRSSALTAMVTPLAVVELLWLRRLANERHARRRPNVIGVLRRPR